MSLKNRIEQLNARNQAIVNEIKAMAEIEGDEATTLEAINALNLEFDENDKKLETYARADERALELSAARNQAVIPKGIKPGQPTPAEETLSPWDKLKTPAVARFQKSKVFARNEDAYFSGLYLMAACGNGRAKAKLAEVGQKVMQGSPRNAMEEATDTAGGFTVPTPLAATIIRLVEEYGVFRRNTRNMPMTAATLDVPKRAGGFTVVYPGEGAAITPSDLTFAQVNLIAKKYAMLTLMSTELDEDSIISMTDLITTEIAWAFAQAEDTNSFLGDGTAGFGGITGIQEALAAGSQVSAANIAAVDLELYLSMLAKMPRYAGLSPKWYVNSFVYESSMKPIAYAAGGNNVADIAGGMATTFLGYPVEFTQVLPKELSLGGLGAVFGDLAMGSMLGVRRDVTIKVLNELYAASDQIGIVATMRSATEIHDVGDATNAGSIVGLYGSA